MKRKLFTLMTLLLCVCTGAWADDVTLTVSNTSAVSETFADGSILYSIDSNGRVNETTKFGADKDIVVSGTKTKGAALVDSRFAIKFPVAVTGVTIYGYNSSSGRALSKVYTSTTMEKSSYTEITSSTTKSSSSAAPNYTYTFTASWASEIAANTAIWFAFSNGCNFYKIVYTPAAAKYNITLNANGGESNGAAKVAVGDTKLTINTSAVKDGSYVKGYYTAASSGTKVAEADGTLVASVTGFTNGSGEWTLEDNTTLYAEWGNVTTTITYNLTTSSESTTLDNCTSATPTSGDIVASTTINTYGTADCESDQSAKTDETQKLKIDTDYNEDNYYEWTFTIGSSVNFMPTQVVMKFQAVSGLTQYKVELTDGTTSPTTNFVQTTSAGGTLETLTWNITPGTAFAPGTTGRLKLWAYKKESKATAFRLGSPITIKGVVNVPITPGHDKTTYVTTKKLDFSDVAGLKAYVATAAGASGVTMTPVGAVPASTPLLLVGTAATTYNIPIVASADAPATNKLVAGDGTTDMSAVGGFNYILFSDGLFYQVTSGTIATTKAYLHLDSAPGAHALDIIFEENGEATGITEVANEQQTKANGQYFNLAGQRVNTNHKGIVIVNGKKYFNK